MASSSNALTPNKNNTLMRLLWDLELSRKEAFEQLRKDKEQSDLRIQEHIQRLEAREKERDPRKRGHSMLEVIPKSSLIGKLKLIKFS